MRRPTIILRRSGQGEGPSSRWPTNEPSAAHQEMSMGFKDDVAVQSSSGNGADCVYWTSYRFSLAPILSLSINATDRLAIYMLPLRSWSWRNPSQYISICCAAPTLVQSLSSSHYPPISSLQASRCERGAKEIALFALAYCSRRLAGAFGPSISLSH